MSTVTQSVARLSCTIAFSIVALLAATQLPATTWHVNDTRDAVDALPGDGACEATSGAGDCTLRAAIQESNASPGLDAIDVPEGTFELGIPGLHEDRGAAGDLDITDSLWIRGAGRDRTVIDALGRDRAIDVPGERRTLDVVIESLTITGGSLSGIRALGDGALRLTDCAITDNGSPGTGGGIYAACGLLLLERSVVADNVADHHAGGIRIHGGQLVLVDSVLERNVITGDCGGGGVFASRSEIALVRSELHDAIADGSCDESSGFAGQQHLVAGVVGMDAAVSTSDEILPGPSIAVARAGR